MKTPHEEAFIKLFNNFCKGLKEMEGALEEKEYKGKLSD